MLGEGEDVQMTFEIRRDSPDPVCSQKRKPFAICKKSSWVFWHKMSLVGCIKSW